MLWVRRAGLKSWAWPAQYLPAKLAASCLGLGGIVSGSQARLWQDRASKDAQHISWQVLDLKRHADFLGRLFNAIVIWVTDVERFALLTHFLCSVG